MPLLSDVRQLRLRYRDREGVWRRCLDLTDPTRLPRAVELVSDSEPTARCASSSWSGTAGEAALPARERGAALLAVLLLVAVTGAIAAAAMEGLRLSRAVAANATALDQARAFADGAEQLALLTLDDQIARSPDRTTLDGGWNGAVRRMPMPGGAIAEARVRDGGNCFNVNSVVEGKAQTTLVRRPSGSQVHRADDGARHAPNPTRAGSPRPRPTRSTALRRTRCCRCGRALGPAA